MADGTVLFAGLEPPHPCPQLGRTVQALLIEIVHLTPSGDQFAVVYGHLSRIDVATGATVSDRTRVGLSGNTGCSGTPHLHFGVFRNVSGDYRVLDRYRLARVRRQILGSRTPAARSAVGYGSRARRPRSANLTCPKFAAVQD